MQSTDRLQHMPIALFTMIMGDLTLTWEKASQTGSISLLALSSPLLVVLLLMLSALILLPLFKTGNAIRRGKIFAAED